MFASIFILILLLPVACLPLTLDTFFSSTDLSEMGVCLKKSTGWIPDPPYDLGIMDKGIFLTPLDPHHSCARV
jgi:hypothetical protein